MSAYYLFHFCWPVKRVIKRVRTLFTSFCLPNTVFVERRLQDFDESSKVWKGFFQCLEKSAFICAIERSGRINSSKVWKNPVEKFRALENRISGKDAASTFCALCAFFRLNLLSASGTLALLSAAPSETSPYLTRSELFGEKRRSPKSQKP